MYTVVDISVLRAIQASNETKTSTSAAQGLAVYTQNMYLLQSTADKTRNICIAFVQRRPNVKDVGPTLYKCYTLFCVCWETRCAEAMSVCRLPSVVDGGPAPNQRRFTSSHVCRAAVNRQMQLVQN